MDGSPPTSTGASRLRSFRPATWAAPALAALALAAGASLTAGVVAPSADAVGDCTPGADWGTSRPDLAAQTVSLVNAHRASLGLAQLTVSSSLAASAEWKARHMARYLYMAHNDPAPPVARTTGERMQACGVTTSWGENIAYGYPTAQQVVTGWLNSAGHRANIENPSWRAIGSGAAASASGQLYWAHTFGTSTGGSPPPPAPTPPPPAPAPPPPAPAPSPTPPPPAPAPAPKPAPAPSPAPSPTPSPAPTPGSPVAASTPQASSGSGVVLRDLKLLPRQPQAGRTMSSSVGVFKRGTRVKTAHVFCSARLDGRPLRVVVHRFRTGKATCAWKLPASASGKLVSAAIVVQQGRVTLHAPFRARIVG